MKDPKKFRVCSNRSSSPLVVAPPTWILVHCLFSTWTFGYTESNRAAPICFSITSFTVQVELSWTCSGLGPSYCRLQRTRNTHLSPLHKCVVQIDPVDSMRKLVCSASTKACKPILAVTKNKKMNLRRSIICLRKCLSQGRRDPGPCGLLWVWAHTGVSTPIIGSRWRHRRTIEASNSISDIIMFQRRICHFVQRRKKEKTGGRKTITAIPLRTASIYNQPFRSRREGEAGVSNHMSALLLFTSVRRIQWYDDGVLSHPRRGGHAWKG